MRYDINNRPTLLEEGDRVIFELKGEALVYWVYSSFLDNESGSNERIFNSLDIPKFQAARDAYGYETEDGDWPESKYRDFEALTRLVNALFDEIADRIATKEAKPSARKFKIGDLVKLTESGAVIAKLQPGALAKITKDDGGREDGGIPYRVDFESHADEERSECHWFNADRMEPAEAAPAPAFKIGDRVKLIKKNPVRKIGTEGTVHRVMEDGTVDVHWFEGGSAAFGPSAGLIEWTLDALQKVDASTSEDDPSPEDGNSFAFKVGDRVRVKASVTEPEAGWGGLKRDGIGTIADAEGEWDDKPAIFVDFPGYIHWIARAHELELVEEPEPLGYVIFNDDHFAVRGGAAEAGKVYPLVKISDGVRFTEPLPGYSEGIAVRSALVDGTAILMDKDGNPIERKESPAPSEDPHAKIAQLQHQIEAQAGAMGRMTRKINRQRLELRRFHDLEEMRKRLPKPAPVTLDAFFAQLGIPSEFRELLREMLADLHKARTVQVAYVAKSGEEFANGGAVGIMREGEVLDVIAIATLFQDSVRRLIEEAHA